MKFLTILVLCLILISCNSSNSGFEGVWLNTTNEREIITIKKNGSSFLVDIRGKKIPAEEEGEFLKMGPDQRAVFNKENDQLIVGGNEYKKLNGDHYLGRWTAKGVYLDISAEGDEYKVFHSISAGYYQETDYVRTYDGTVANGLLEGDYHGMDEGGRYTISPAGKGQIQFSADYNKDLVLTRSPYTPLHSSNFPGTYFGEFFTDGTGFTITVRDLGGGRFKISDVSEGSNNPEEWSGRFRDGYLLATVWGGNAQLRFRGKDTLEVKGLFNQESNDVFDFIRIGNEEQPKEIQREANPPNTGTTPIASNDFYILSVDGKKTEEDAKKSVSELKNQGYEADYLWIPDYNSLSGNPMYAVYVGPFETIEACALATEKYRKKIPSVYGLLVSTKNKRVEIRSRTDIKVIEPYK